MKLYIKRKFAAAHWLPGYDGPCRRLHGHTFLVEVWLEGEVDPKTGMLVDFKEVKNIIDRYDHCCLNFLPEFWTTPPTAENIALELFTRIGCATRVKVWESDDCTADVGRSPPEEVLSLGELQEKYFAWETEEVERCKPTT